MPAKKKTTYNASTINFTQSKDRNTEEYQQSWIQFWGQHKPFKTAASFIHAMILSMKYYEATHTQLSLYINLMAKTFHNSRIINKITHGILPLYSSRIERNVLVPFSLPFHF